MHLCIQPSETYTTLNIANYLNMTTFADDISNLFDFTHKYMYNWMENYVLRQRAIPYSKVKQNKRPFLSDIVNVLLNV